MRVRTVETISELQQLLNLPNPGALLEDDLDVVETDCDHNSRKRRDAEVLCTLAANIEGNCLDLGTSHGRSAYKLGTNLQPGYKVFTVNILPEQYDESGGKLITHLLTKEEIGIYYREAGQQNIEQHYANTAKWNIPSEIDRLAMAFIDAAHDEEMVYADSKLIYDRVAPGGFICWHDFNPGLRTKHHWIDDCMRGVERFLDEYGFGDSELIHLKDSWIAILKKPSAVTVSSAAETNPAARSMRDLRYVWAYPAYSDERIAEDNARIARIRSWGYDVVAFPLKCPGGWWHFPKLDAAWKHKDRALLDQYDELEKLLSDRDVLIAAGGSMLHPKFVDSLDAYTVFTCCDDPESSEVLSKPAAPAFDFSFSMNVACLDDYRSWGCQNVDWFYHAIHPEATATGITEETILNGERDLDIVLLCERVFNLSDRAQRVERLVEEFPNAFVRGHGWPGGHVEPAPVYARSKIGWNLHNSIGPCNSRLITLPANGVMQICDNKSDLGKLLKLDEEVVGFDSIEECIDKTRYYLEHDEERRVIAAKGWKRVQSDYTEQAQWERILNCVSNDCFKKLERKAGLLGNAPVKDGTSFIVSRHAFEEKPLPRITGAKPKVLLLVDRPGWAYDNAAQAIARELADEFELRIEYVAQQPDLNAWKFDLLYVFFWGETYHHQFNIPAEKVIKEISSHRWENEDSYGRLTPQQTAQRHLADAGTWTATSHRLQSTFSPFKNVYHVPNGFDPDQFSNPDRSGKLRIGWAGNAKDPCKGLNDILAPASGNDFELFIADGGLNATQMSEFYKTIDVLCVASTAEGEPLTLVEGMASGCFPVCVDVGIVPELVTHGQNGLIVERKPEAFQSAWQWCRTNPQRVREAGRKNAFDSLRTRRWKTVAEKWRQPLRSAWLGLQGGGDSAPALPSSAEMWQRNLGENLLQWPARARKAAEWIARLLPLPQHNATMVDLGCGHQTLKQLIPANLAYTPVDNIPREVNVQVYDLEKERPEQNFSVATSLGLLEYLNNLESFLKWVASHAGNYVFSYNDCSDPERLKRQHWKCRWSFQRIVDYLKEQGGQILRVEDLGKKEMLCAVTFVGRSDVEVMEPKRPTKKTKTLALLSAGIDGDNSGDALIVDATRRLLNGNELREFPLLQKLNDEQIAAINDCDATIICGTNLYQHVFACPLTPEVLEKIKTPIIPLGVGGSAPIGRLPQMDAEGIRSVRMIHDRCNLGSVRDPGSLAFIQQLGIKNIELTGCPVLFHALREPEFKPDPGNRVALSVRARLLHVEEHWNQKQEQTLRLLCERFNPTLVLQSPYDLELAKQLNNEFGVEYRYDPKWQHGPLTQTITDSDRAIGFRLHFGMLSLAYGLPSIFLATDTRTSEFCNMVGVPYHAVQGYEDNRLIAELESPTPDYTTFQRRWRELAAVMAETLDQNDIPHVLRTKVSGL